MGTALEFYFSTQNQIALPFFKDLTVMIKYQEQRFIF